MRPITTNRTWLSWLGTATVVFVSLFGLDHPLYAQPQANVIVSDYGEGSLRFFKDNTMFIGKTTGSNGQGFGEGVACAAGATNEIFAVGTVGNLGAYSADLTTGIVTSLSPPTFLKPSGSNIAGLSLSGSTLYAAGGTGVIYSYNTTATTASATTSTPVISSSGLFHDVVYNPANGVVYATYPSGKVVYAFNASTLKEITADEINLPTGVTYGHEGLAVDSSGNLFVSNLNTVGNTQPGVYEFSPSSISSASSVWCVSGVASCGYALAHSFSSALFDGPLGMAIGPNGDLYVANFHSIGDGAIPGIIKIDITSPSPTTVAINNAVVRFGAVLSYISMAGINPKYVQFIQDCTGTPNAFIEICKAPSTINPVPPVYKFTVSGSAFSTSQNPLTIPAGECSGPIAVYAPFPPGTVDITELPTPGFAVGSVTAVGYSGPPLFQPQDRLEHLQGGTATVIIAPGGTSTETLVIFTNYPAPPAELKVCKVAGANVNVGTPFNFTITSSSGTVTQMVEAGPLTEGGYCVPLAGTFTVGTSVSITENIPSVDLTPLVTVNGANTSVTCTTGNSNTENCAVAALIGPGINEVSFTNSICTTPACAISSRGGGLPSFKIGNYSLVNQQDAVGARSYFNIPGGSIEYGDSLGSNSRNA